MANPFLGEIRMFAGNFAPQGWAFCNGQILAIAQYTALFSLLGTNYGGDGRANFALPDMRSRSPLHTGQAPGLSNYLIGQNGGAETETLVINEIPSHLHLLTATTAAANSATPENAVLGKAVTGVAVANAYAALTTTDAMAPSAIGVTGGSQPHENRPPYLGVNFIIALQGIFPPRN